MRNQPIMKSSVPMGTNQQAGAGIQEALSRLFGAAKQPMMKQDEMRANKISMCLEETSMLTMLKPEDLDERLAMDYLDELEFTAHQLEKDPSQKDTEKRQKTAELIDQVKKRLAQCLKQRQKANYRRLCKSNFTQIWQLKKLVDACPGLVLHKPDDFILYWYVHGEFPCGMSLWDMGKIRRELQNRLNQLICRKELDSAYATYCREKTKTQLQQLQDMRGVSFRKECGVGAHADMEDSFKWLEKEPPFLFYLPDEPENPEDLTIPELGWEIEKQEYDLLSLKSEENGKVGIGKPFNWQEAVDTVNTCLDRLRTVLRQRIEKALGVAAEDPSVPEGFQDGDFPIWFGLGELERAEDIVAGWYLSDDFPVITSCEKMQQVEAELKRQQAALEAEEPALENEAEHALWQFRMEQRAEQLEQVQNMMWNQADDWEFVDLEEEPADEW